MGVALIENVLPLFANECLNKIRAERLYPNKLDEFVFIELLMFCNSFVLKPNNFLELLFVWNDNLGWMLIVFWESNFVSILKLKRWLKLSLFALLVSL